jgi:hypothetical protein
MSLRKALPGRHSVALLGALMVGLVLTSSRTAGAETATGTCNAYIVVEPLPVDVVKLLSSPVVVPSPQGFADASARQLQEWDLPSKVTAWRERPSPDELARRWEESGRKSSGTTKGANQALTHRPYVAQPLSPEQWKDVEKWFPNEGPKKLPGLCVDAGKATYRLEIGVISGGAFAPTRGSSNPHEYEQMSQVRAQDNAVGPNAGTFNPTAHESRYDELNGLGGSGDPSAHTCVYFYRRVGGSAPPQPPDYYYCHSGSDMPKSVLTTMLKYLAKAGLP